MHCKDRTALWAALLAALLSPNWASAQEVTVSVAPDADTFVRSQAPASNYGGGGALSVSGSTAVNGDGVQNGLFDSLMRFPMSNVVAVLNDALGGHDWLLTGAQLVVTEIATPDNAIFNRGVGTFEIRWLAQDGWTEGTGRPMTPTTDGLSWQDLPSMLNSNVDVSLGIVTNSGLNGTISFILALADPTVQDVRAAGELELYLTAASPDVGFTFNSRSFGNTNAQPRLRLTARANPRPRIEAIQPSGGSVTLTFRALSNWTYTLQYATTASAQPVVWSNLVTLPVQQATTNFLYVDEPTDRQRFYRLCVAP